MSNRLPVHRNLAPALLLPAQALLSYRQPPPSERACPASAAGTAAADRPARRNYQGQAQWVGLHTTPEPIQRRQVEALTGYGIPEAEIAAIVDMDPKTLRKHYRHELDHGHSKANAKVAENLYRKATGEGREAVTAAIFWLKARARWKEVNVTELGGVDGQPIRQVTTIRRVLVRPGDGVQGALRTNTSAPCIELEVDR